MTFLKNLAVSLFSFLLFLSLTLFGLVFAVQSTALNPDFVTAELNRLEIASLVKEFVRIESPSDFPDLDKTIDRAITKLEPEVKRQSSAAIYSVYDYLLGRTLEPDLKSTLKESFLSADFVTPLVNSLDVSPFLTDFVSDYIAKAIPIKIADLDRYVSRALAGAEADLKKQAIAISRPVFDYLLIESPTLKVSISLEQAKQSFVRELLASPPPELALIPRNTLQELSALIPSTYPLDEKLITPKVRTDVAEGIAAAEDSLRQARQYVKYVQQAYTVLLALMALMALGIILIVRNVKDITHRLGVPLLTYGAIEYAGVWVTKYLISTGKLRFPEIPSNLEAWLLQLTSDSLRPLEIFSLAILIAGAVLTVISFLYKRKQDLTWS